MTTPTGHQDFQDVVQWRGGPILDQTYSVTAGTPLQATLYLGNFASLQVHITANANTGVQFNLTWYTDAGMSVVIDSQAWDVWSCALRMVTPILGPYLKITVQAGTGGTDTGFVYVGPVNTPVPKTNYQSTKNAINRVAISIPASSQDQMLMPDLTTGTIVLTCDDIHVSGKLRVSTEELNAAGTVLGDVLPTFTMGTAQILTGAARESPVRLTVVNTDGAAAHDFTARLTILSE
jgi:hypothetical protein